MSKNSLVALVAILTLIFYCSLRHPSRRCELHAEEAAGGEQAETKGDEEGAKPAEDEGPPSEGTVEGEAETGGEETTAEEVAAAPVEGAEEEVPEEPEAVGGASLIKAFGVVGWVIVALSCVSLALIIKNFIALRRSAMLPDETQQRLEALFNERKIQDAMTLCRQEPSLLAKVVGAGLSEIRSGYDDMREIMQEVGEEESIKLHQDVGYLSLIGNIAPMLGLLGTVIGMITTFQKIAGSEEGITNPRLLASGIQHALLTTCLGLMVAIPTLACFAFLRNKVVTIMLEVGVITEELMSRFKTMRVASPSSPSAAKTSSTGQGGSSSTPTTPTRS